MPHGSEGWKLTTRLVDILREAGRLYMRWTPRFMVLPPVRQKPVASTEEDTRPIAMEEEVPKPSSSSPPIKREPTWETTSVRLRRPGVAATWPA